MLWLTSQVDTHDVTFGNAIQQSHLHPIGLGISGLSKHQLDDRVVIKQENHNLELSTPRLNVCTTFSSSSSPDPISPISPLEVKRSRAGKSSKLPSQAVGILNTWLNGNRHYPYPNAETKQTLANECGITVKQVTTWFTNIRQRQLRSQDNDEGRPRNGNTQPSMQGSRKGKKKDYGRSNGASPIDGLLSPFHLSPCASASENSSGEGENWQCTFCRVSLTSKSWRRHEETQHHPKYQWTCLAFGPRVPLPSSSSFICAFCELLNPDDAHFRLCHRIDECSHKDAKERTFGRPDHLQQHARNFHKCTQPLSELVRDTWRRDGPGMIDNQGWTCGFCQEVLPTWDARATHISGHFKAGLTMAHWRDNQPSQPTLPRGQSDSNELAAPDAVAGMSNVFPASSAPISSHTHQDVIGSAQSFHDQNFLMAPFMPSQMDVSNMGFNPFYVYDNTVGTYISNFAPSYSHGGMDPTATQSSEAPPADFGYAEFPETNNHSYDSDTWGCW